MCPYLVEQVNERSWEFIANGLDMGHPHYSGMDKEEEAALIKGVLDSLREYQGSKLEAGFPPFVQNL